MNNTIITPIKAQFELQTSLLINVLTNISDEEATLQSTENLNSIKWIAGHIVNTRISLLNILTGNGEDQEYSKLFGKGTSKNIGQAYPTIKEINLKLLSITDELFNSFELATNEFLISKAPFQTSIPDATILGLVAFMLVHEANHCGQISILRKLNANQFALDLTSYDKIICN